MRYRLLIALTALTLTACSFQMQVGSPTASETPLVLNLSPAASPPSTEPPGGITPAVQENSAVTPIQFAPGGTYMDVVDSLQAGQSKTYSIDAMQGQVMSVSTRLAPFSSWTVIAMRIVGADGTVLCPTAEFMSCYFWRGALPATQTYWVTLMPEVDVEDFTLRVAINPPNTASQSFQFVSQDQIVSFAYTDEFAPVRLPEVYISKIMPEASLQLIDTAAYDKTNLIEAYFLFGVTNDPGIVASCTLPVSMGGEETVTGEVNINGILFTRSEAAGLGAGNIYEQIFHRAAHQGRCYEVTFFVHSANIGNYAPEAGIREFDRAALQQKFESLLSTLVIR
jgi:hypothetical protein